MCASFNPVTPKSKFHNKTQDTQDPIKRQPANTEALIIRIGFGGILYYYYNKEPPKEY